MTPIVVAIPGTSADGITVRRLCAMFAGTYVELATKTKPPTTSPAIHGRMGTGPRSATSVEIPWQRHRQTRSRRLPLLITGKTDVGEHCQRSSIITGGVLGDKHL